MASQELSPDLTLVSQTTFTESNSGNIDDSPGSPDGNWALIGGNNVSGNIRVSFPTPSGAPTTGAGLQQIDVYVRQQSVGQTGTPTVTLEIYETGGGTALASSAALNVTSESGQLLSFTWNSNVLATADGSAVECNIVVTKSGGGPSARESVDIGAVAWAVDYLPNAYTLGVDSGVFLVAGKTADILATRLLTTAAGSFVLTGVDPFLTLVKTLQVDSGSFSLNGSPAALIADRLIKGGTGNFTLTGIPANLPAAKILHTDSGTYALTGSDAFLSLTYSIQAEVGSFSLNGIPADLIADRVLNTDSGSFTLTGVDAELDFQGLLPANSGFFSLTGNPARLIADRALNTDSGSFVLTGSPVGFSIAKNLYVDTGVFILTGIDAELVPDIGNYVRTEVGSYILSGKPAALNYNEYKPSCLGYSFKREAVVYVAYAGLRYQIDISEVNFTQTFQEHSYSTKSIQTANMFEQSVINKANPANFDITLPAIRESDLRILFDRALDYDTFDLYVESTRGNFKVENCVITNANFIIESQRPLTLGIQGEATKVLMTSGEPLETLVARSPTRTYNRISDLDIELVGTKPMNNSLASVSVELQNDIQWTPYTHVNGAEQGTTMYPSAFTVKKRILSGSFTKYLLDTETVDLFKWSRNTSLTLFAGQSTYGFNMNIPNCSYTNRIGTGEVFTQSFDWRMTHNPTELLDVITYITLP